MNNRINILIFLVIGFCLISAQETKNKDGKVITADYSGNKNNYSVLTLVRSIGDPVTGKSKEGIKEIPTSFEVEQNYPNPYNTTTNLSFTIGHSLFVSLKVYDMNGREIATLIDEEKQAGYYQVIFDTINLSSGIYFYKLQAGKFVQTKKMILLH